MGVGAVGLGVHLARAAQRIDPARGVEDVPTCGVVLDVVAVTHRVLLVFVCIIHPLTARCGLLHA